MKIGIDITPACKQRDGIGRYVKEFIEFINNNVSSEDEIFVYSSVSVPGDIWLNTKFHVRCQDMKSTIWLLTVLPKQIKKDQLDVFWQPNHLFPFKINRTRVVITVHDMSAYSYTEYAERNTNIVFKLFLKPSCKKADRIIAISKDCAKDVVKDLGISKDKIDVVYNGKKMFPNGEDVTAIERQDCLNKYKLYAGEYLLFVGTLSPRKNAEVIVNAYLEYRKNGGNKKIVFAGRIASNCQNILEIINQSQFKNDIIVCGYVDDLTKRVFYYNAGLVLFPSRLEGFGVPLLEAMQAGVPVITSNVSCMPEIAGDAAIYLENIDDWKELAARIFEVEQMSKEETARLIQKGYARVEFFDSMNYCEQTLNVIKKVGKKE